MTKVSFKAGRINQKRRTRQALTDAASQLLKEKGDFSVDEVAEKAMVSRATAYRYFSDVDSLKYEAVLDMNTEYDPNILNDAKTLSLEERILRVHEHILRLSGKNEAAFRAFLGAFYSSTAKDPANTTNKRSTRRLPLIEAAIKPYRAEIAEDDYDKLLLSIAVLTGVESYLMLKDVFEMDDERVSDVLSWAILRLLPDTMT